MNFVKNESGISVLGKEISSFKTEAHVKTQDQNSDEDLKYLYLMAGVHGDEVEGVYVLDKLFSWLKAKNDLNLNMIVIPTLNVDGYEIIKRTNHNGVDLNRNLNTASWDAKFEEDKYNPGTNPLSEPENQFLVSLFKKYPPLFVLSFHSWKPILNYNGDCKDIADFIASYNSYPSEGSIGYPTPGSLGEYGPSVLGSPVLTYELPPHHDGLTLKSIWENNKQGLIALFETNILKEKFKL